MSESSSRLTAAELLALTDVIVDPSLAGQGTVRRDLPVLRSRLTTASENGASPMVLAAGLLSFDQQEADRWAEVHYPAGRVIFLKDGAVIRPFQPRQTPQRPGLPVPWPSRPNRPRFR